MGRVPASGLRLAGLATARPEGRRRDPGARGEIPVDDHCRAGDGLWAVGDVTGISLFTHVAMYQGRVAADNILGRDRAASYHGIPRVIFADPEIAATGYTAAQAREAGIGVAAAEIALADSISRPWTYERDPRGVLGLIADRRRRVLAGAWAVAPLASEWIHRPRWPSAPRSPSTPCWTRSQGTPPTARPTSSRWSSSTCRNARPGLVRRGACERVRQLVQIQLPGSRRCPFMSVLPTVMNRRRAARRS